MGDNGAGDSLAYIFCMRKVVAQQVLRRVMPDRVRTAVGTWMLNLASRRWPMLKAYLTALRGKIPEDMWRMGEYCVYSHDGRRIYAPWNAAMVFLEIFEDEVYEQVWRPGLGEVVLDIGAYVGMFTVKASLAVGDAGKVIAVEPHPRYYGLLISNCHGLGNVETVKKAVAAEYGRCRRLYSARAAGADTLVGGTSEYIEVGTITLDELVSELGLSRLDFIKLDAEGAELNVLKGGKETLKKGTRLAIAIYHTSEDGRRSLECVTALLEDAGYRMTVNRGLRSYVYAEKI